MGHTQHNQRAGEGGPRRGAGAVPARIIRYYSDSATAGCRCRVLVKIRIFALLSFVIDLKKCLQFDILVLKLGKDFLFKVVCLLSKSVGIQLFVV